VFWTKEVGEHDWKEVLKGNEIECQDDEVLRKSRPLTNDDQCVWTLKQYHNHVAPKFR